MQRKIVISQARENNLKNVSLEIPHYKLIVVTGVSGSGKSSLIYDVIAREGQRLFFDNFLGGGINAGKKMNRPDVESVSGLFPVIAVDQNSVIRNPRSTVGTLTEIQDYLRLLFARAGKTSDRIRLSRSHFSFNHPAGQCPNCKGLGVSDHIDPQLLVGDGNKSLREGALVLTTPTGYIIYSQVTMDVLNQVCNAEGFSVDIPWNDLSHEQKQIVLNGSEKIKILFGKHTLESRMKWTGITAKPREEGYYKGIVPVMEEILKRDRNPNILRFARSFTCPECNGKRLNKNALTVTLAGKTIDLYSGTEIRKLLTDFSELKNQPELRTLTAVVDSLIARCRMLDDLGLGYLTPDRESTGLSGGEAMRIRLSNQVATGLRNVLYILDEPSAGLHPSDHHRLLKILRELVNKGNTVITVEHDEQTMRAADHIIDIGPGPGNAGGEIVYNGPADLFLTNVVNNSKTNMILGRKKTSPEAAQLFGKYLTVQNASLNNLKNISVRFAEGGFNVLTGVSGAGKSSLVRHFLNQTVKHKDGGTDVFRKVIFVDQSPIGRTPKSNPATYTGMSDAIRDLLAALPESKKAGYKKGLFSFVVKGGRCEDCGGAGVQQMGMHFLGNVDVLCETCNGRRFTEETLAIQYSGKNIFDILELSVEEAHQFFSTQKKIRAYTSILLELGLGYLRLGQPSTTLSGGEAQRIKLATELVKSSGGKILYILDEPTTGLHSADVDVLISALKKLTSKGNTLITVEHHADFILAADHIVDLGPGSGSEGGTLLFEGSPGEMLKSCSSPTAVELGKHLKAGNEIPEAVSTNKLTQESSIILKGVCTNNLQSVQAEFESGKITCVTGVSGSGKSSLVCDTLYAESQRRLMDGMSSYIRQFIGKTGNPVLDSSYGITPAITVLKKNTVNNPRSTTGTYTGVYDLYRMMFSRISSNESGPCKLLSSAFSFNHEAGACPACRGLGEKTVCNPQKLVTHPEKSLLDGALDGTKTGRFYGDPFGQYTATLRTAGTKNNIDFAKAFDALSEKERMLAMRGCGDEVFEVNWNYKRGNVEGTHHFKGRWPGFLGLVEEEYNRKQADHRGESMLPVMMSETCTECKGHRINPKNLEYKVGDLNIGELTSLSAEEAIEWLAGLIQNKEFTGLSGEVFRLLVPEIRQKLDSLIRSGLGYIQLNRKVSSLSGGEYQRLKIAGMMKSGLTGLTCILDEPSFGLHSKDTERMSSLISAMNHEGNTVVMIEQSEQMLNLAHKIIELGPGAGKDGGTIIYSGSGEDYIQYKPTRTERKLPHPGPGIVVRGARANNLKTLNAEFPSNCFSVICGLSGSGKTSLLNDVIYKSLLSGKPVNCDTFSGREHFGKIVYIHQDVPSGSSLSTPLTYLGLSDAVRRIFASTESARKKEMGSSYFSWQSKDGQCPVCQGHGGHPVSLDFWSDAWVVCDECSGNRYKPDVLAIEADGLNMAKLLNISLYELGVWFGKNAEPKDLKKLSMIFELAEKTGISHLPAGQALNTLSTGELQRLKLVESLASAEAENTLFLLDEPTGGLHPADVEKLLILIRELADKGGTIICVSHNDLLIETASLVLELGPGGGNQGGMVINKTMRGNG